MSDNKTIPVSVYASSKKSIGPIISKIISIIVGVLIVLFVFRYQYVMGKIKLHMQKTKYEKAIKDMKAEYEQKLKTVITQYNRLLDTFNTVVDKTIITEIKVEDGNVFAIIRNYHRLRKKIPLKVSLKYPVYVDYIIKDNSIILRRVFDAVTPPSKAHNIVSNLDVNWDDKSFKYGKAIYKKFSTNKNAIYQITVTGNGSLGIEQNTNTNYSYATNARFEFKVYEPMTNKMSISNINVGFNDVIGEFFK